MQKLYLPLYSLIICLIASFYTQNTYAQNDNLDDAYGLFFQVGYGNEYGNLKGDFSLAIENSANIDETPGWGGNYDLGAGYRWLGYVNENSVIIVKYKQSSEPIRRFTFSPNLSKQFAFQPETPPSLTLIAQKQRYQISIKIEKLSIGTSTQKLCKIQLSIKNVP